MTAAYQRLTVAAMTGLARWRVLDATHLEEALPGGARAIYTIGEDDGRLIVSEVYVSRPRGVTSRNCRVSPAAALEIYREETRRELAPERLRIAAPLFQLATRLGVGQAEPDASAAAVVQTSLAIVQSQGQGGRLLRLATTAALYVQACDRGERTPNEAVGRLQGRPASHVRDDLKAARAAGLLEAAPVQGMAGGRLTPKAIELLRKEGAQ